MSFIVGSIAIGSVAAIAGGAFGAKGAKDAAGIAVDGSLAEIEFNRESRDLARADQAPFREAGYTALEALMSLTGLAGTGSRDNAPVEEDPGRAVNPEDYLAGLSGGSNRGGQRNDNFFIAPRARGGAMYGAEWGNGPRPRPGDYAARPAPQNPNAYNVNENGPEDVHGNGSYRRGNLPLTVPSDPEGYVAANEEANADEGYVRPEENPGGVEGGYNFMTDPGYEFRFNEGQRMLETRAAAAGGLLSGGFARRITRYAQDYASGEYQNVYNRIANIAGLGQAGATNSANNTMFAGAQMGNAASQGANSSAYGSLGATNAWVNGLNQISQLPWERLGGGGGNKEVPGGSWY